MKIAHSKRDARPIDHGLLHQRLPVGAVVSILHRVSGVALFASLPLLLFGLGQSLRSPQVFSAWVATVSRWPGRAALVGAVFLLAHHGFAGIRHLLLDLDIGATRTLSRGSAYVVLAGAFAVALWVAL